MAVPELSPASPYASPTNELVVIEISDDDSSASDDGDECNDKDDAQCDDAAYLEDGHDVNIDISVPEGIDDQMTWEVTTPANHEENFANQMQDAASDDESDIEGASLSDADGETDLTVHNTFGCEEAPSLVIQSGSTIPNNTNLVLEELVSVRATLAKIKAQLRHLLKIRKPKATPHSTKRKRNPSPTPPLRRQRKKAREVNIRATRAWLQFDDELERLEYIWQRGRGGERGCWMRNFGPESERVNGDYLLSYGSDLCVEIRANGDWLPVAVRWHEETERFEGFKALDGKVFEVDGVNMMDLMCGVVGSYVGHVF